MLKKPKFIALILTQNNENTINKCIKSIYKFVDKIIIIDGFSSDNTLKILKKKKIKILKYKFTSCLSSLSFGMSYILKKYKNSIVIRLDSDEKIIFFKSIKAIKVDLSNIIYKKKNIAILRNVVYKNLIISNQLSRFTIRISPSDSKYDNNLMDEKILGPYENYYYIKIIDFASISLNNHIKKHINYAYLEFLTYQNFIFLSKKRKFYYRLPIFLRSTLYSLYLILFTVKINKNFFYNFSYQFIRGFFFRLYVDFLILKKNYK